MKNTTKLNVSAGLFILAFVLMSGLLVFLGCHELMYTVNTEYGFFGVKYVWVDPFRLFHGLIKIGVGMTGLSWLLVKWLGYIYEAASFVFNKRWLDALEEDEQKKMAIKITPKPAAAPEEKKEDGYW